MRASPIFVLLFTLSFSVRGDRGVCILLQLCRAQKTKENGIKENWVRGYPIRRLRNSLSSHSQHRIGLSPRSADSGHSALAAQSWAFSSDDIYRTGHLWSRKFLVFIGTFASLQWTFIHDGLGFEYPKHPRQVGSRLVQHCSWGSSFISRLSLPTHCIYPEFSCMMIFFFTFS